MTILKRKAKVSVTHCNCRLLNTFLALDLSSDWRPVLAGAEGAEGADGADGADGAAGLLGAEGAEGPEGGLGAEGALGLVPPPQQLAS